MLQGLKVKLALPQKYTSTEINNGGKTPELHIHLVRVNI